MQACKAYYNKGLFVPIGFGKLPEGTQAIITILEEIPNERAKKLRALDKLWEGVQAAADEEMPLIEPIRFREVEL